MRPGFAGSHRRNKAENSRPHAEYVARQGLAGNPTPVFPAPHCPVHAPACAAMPVHLNLIMAKKETTMPAATCSSCGAPLDPNDDQCSLCGWPVGEQDYDQRERRAGDEEPAGAPPDEGRGPFCNQCGWQNPAGARFCSACGARLQEIPRKKPAARAPVPPPAPTPPATEEPAHATAGKATAPTESRVSGLHVVILFAGSLLVVGALYLITAFSKRAFPPVEETTSGQATAQSEATRVLPSGVEDQVKRLEAEAAGLTGQARIEKLRELVQLFAQNERPDRAAEVQRSIAEATGAPEDWFQAGHYHYDWMEQQSGELRFAAAQRAAEAYEKGLALGEDDLNIRTALAMAYLNTRAPMQGVQQIRQVLEQDPDHLQGNFYYGVMLMQINRIDQAIAQFERVKQLAGETSPLYQQADMMLQNLRTMGRTPGGSG